jgi:SAM-dependent methyltransferase
VPATGAPGGAEGSERADEARSVERFLGEPTRRLGDWRWLWDGDHRFPIRSHRGVLGRLVVAAKRLLRPFTVAPQADLWERQRIFNLIALEYLQRGEDVRRVVLETHEQRFAHLEAVWRDGLAEVVEHNDALFARVDQKLDRSRRELREVWARLASALAVAEKGGTAGLADARAEHSYLSLERRFRGTKDEILGRTRPYVERLAGKGEVLDLGCGRGEALAVFGAAGIPARGVDGSEAMVEECRRQGLRAERADLFEALAAAAEGSLGGVVSFHVIEHLPGEALDRLVRLARRALKPGGVLVLETPNPASLVVASRNFWRDPTHLRPVHPETLEWLLRDAGFDPVERLDLHPFAADERLPELPTASLPEEQRPLAHAVNELRDRLDDLLFGAQDYAVVGTRPK